MSGVTLGKNCNIGECVFIESGASVADNVTIKNGVQIWAGITIHDGVFIGPNVTFTNDKFPKSRIVPKSPLLTILEPGVSVGANATILPGIIIGKNAFVGAGAVVTRNLPANSLAIGNPARIIGRSPNAEQ